jgi:hypothetical protein
VEGTESLKPLVSYNIANLFTSEVFLTDPTVLKKILPKVTQEMNDKLLSPFMVEDVKKASFSIGDYKVLGPMDYMQFSIKSSRVSVGMILPKKYYRPWTHG